MIKIRNLSGLILLCILSSFRGVAAFELKVDSGYRILDDKYDYELVQVFDFLHDSDQLIMISKRTERGAKISQYVIGLSDGYSVDWIEVPIVAAKGAFSTKIGRAAWVRESDGLFGFPLIVDHDLLVLFQVDAQRRTIRKVYEGRPQEDGGRLEEAFHLESGHVVTAANKYAASSFSVLDPSTELVADLSGKDEIELLSGLSDVIELDGMIYFVGWMKNWNNFSVLAINQEWEIVHAAKIPMREKDSFLSTFIDSASLLAVRSGAGVIGGSLRLDTFSPNLTHADTIEIERISGAYFKDRIFHVCEQKILTTEKVSLDTLETMALELVLQDQGRFDKYARPGTKGDHKVLFDSTIQLMDGKLVVVEEMAILDSDGGRKAGFDINIFNFALEQFCSNKE